MDVLDLKGAATEQSVDLTDPAVISFLLGRHPLAPTWTFQQGSESYRVTLIRVPGWYDPADLEKTLWRLVTE